MMLPSLLQSPYALRLAETLLHFLWQGTFLAVLTAVASLAFRRRSSSLRYGVFVTVLLLMALCPPVTLFWLAPATLPPATMTTEISTPPLPAVSIAPTANSTFDQSKIQNQRSTFSSPAQAPSLLDRLRAYDYSRLSPYALTLYLAGVVLMLARLALGLYGGQTLRRSSEPADSPLVLSALARQAKLLGLAFTPAIAYCRNVMIPTVVGVLRPMILIPASLATALSPDQIEVVLAHELAHIRRHDHLVNILQRLIEAFLFFHPGVWYVSRLIRTEREHCCDDRVLAAGGRSTTYAASLVSIAELCLTARRPQSANVAALGIADNKSQLHRRIFRLLGSPDHEQVRLTRSWAIAALLIAIIAIALTVSASTAKNDNSRRVGFPKRFPKPTTSSPPATQPAGQDLSGAIGTVPQEPVYANSHLAFRIVPILGQEPGLTKKEVDLWVKGLVLQGPQADHGRIDSYGWFPTGVEIPGAVVGEYQGHRYVLLCTRAKDIMPPKTTGDNAWALRDVYPIRDNNRRPVVMVEFDEKGTQLFSRLTKDHIGDTLAIIIDGKVIGAPVLRTHLSRRLMIAGPFTEKEANELAMVLRNQPPSPATSGRAITLGAVTERLLYGTVSRESALDLDTGKLSSGPHVADARAFDDWLHRSGIDVLAMLGTPPFGLSGFDMIAIPVESDQWNMPLDQLKQCLSIGKPGTPVTMTARGKLPLTYLFKTREGGIGILQITKFNDKTPERYLKIRYRLMAQNPLASGESHASDTSNPTSSSPLATQPLASDHPLDMSRKSPLGALMWGALETWRDRNKGGTHVPGTDIPPAAWAPAIRQLKPIRVYDSRLDLIVVLKQTAQGEEGLLIHLMISSDMPPTTFNGASLTLMGDWRYGVYRFAPPPNAAQAIKEAAAPFLPATQPTEIRLEIEEFIFSRPIDAKNLNAKAATSYAFSIKAPSGPGHHSEKFHGQYWNLSWTRIEPEQGINNQHPRVRITDLAVDFARNLPKISAQGGKTQLMAISMSHFVSNVTLTENSTTIAETKPEPKDKELRWTCWRARVTNSSPPTTQPAK